MIMTLHVNSITIIVLQIEQEIDLVLGKKDVMKVCSGDWIRKWTPAILHHSDTLTGKAGVVYKHNQMSIQGMWYV